MNIYRLDTPSDENGNPLSKLICLDENYNLTKWWLDAECKRAECLKTYVTPTWKWCGNKNWPTSDHPASAVLGKLFSQKAINALIDLLDFKRGDLFELRNPDENKYWMYVLWESIDIVDLPKPDVACGHLQPPVKMKSCYQTPHIFESFHESSTWVTEEFKSAVESAGLTGFKFDFLGET